MNLRHLISLGRVASIGRVPSIVPAVFIGLTTMAVIPSAEAHHSFAAYDLTKVTHIAGTVKKFDWINPHSYLSVVTMDDQGKDQVWDIELGAPGQLARGGWTPKSLVAGDKVDLTLHPNKDGSFGGQLTNLTGPNGLHTGGGEGRSGGGGGGPRPIEPRDD